MLDIAARRLPDVLIDPYDSVCEAMAKMDRAGTGGLVLAWPDRQLVGFLSDGDIRRAILRQSPLDDSCRSIANLKPIVATGAVSAADALHLMTAHDINHLPLVGDDGKVVGLVLRKDLAQAESLDQTARERLSSVTVAPEMSIAEAVSRLDLAGTGGLALCDPAGRLVGVLTDGDVRRAVLKGISLDDASITIAVRDPITARDPIAGSAALRLMTEHDINHLPLVDEEGRLVEFLLRRDLISEVAPNLSAVIMAGGFGRRMLPLTEHVPKPMLPVGDRPLLERTIEQLRRSGVKDVSLTTHYLSDSIVSHFGDGAAFGVNISYSNEDQPLGTAGGLKLVKRPQGPFVVMNGDILTGVSFDEMLRFHLAQGALLTVGVRKHQITVPFGVVECDDVRVTELREKPSLTLFINAGVYLLEPEAYDLIPDGERFDMTDLIKRLLDEGHTVVSFPIIEYWQDLGRPEDYEQAQIDLRNARI
jgi:CBS domain-containing protein/dTDP-glucose pyrophosphorylase